MLWLALLSPLGALTFLMCVQRFETWMLGAVPIRATVQPTGSARRTRRFEPAASAIPRGFVPQARDPQRS